MGASTDEPQCGQGGGLWGAGGASVITASPPGVWGVMQERVSCQELLSECISFGILIMLFFNLQKHHKNVLKFTKKICVSASTCMDLRAHIHIKQSHRIFHVRGNQFS